MYRFSPSLCFPFRTLISRLCVELMYYFLFDSLFFGHDTLFSPSLVPSRRSHRRTLGAVTSADPQLRLHRFNDPVSLSISGRLHLWGHMHCGLNRPRVIMSMRKCMHCPEHGSVNTIKQEQWHDLAGQQDCERDDYRYVQQLKGGNEHAVSREAENEAIKRTRT